VLQTGLYLSILGPSYVYVRYRCGRCKRVGERMVQEEKWDASVLQSAQRGPSGAALRKYEEMGEISPDEIIDFHYALERLSAEPDEEVQRS
jgi:hypothetical protein